MLIKMGKATEEILKEGVTLYQAAHEAQTKAPALLGLLSKHSAPVRAWYAYDKGSLVFAKTDIMAFIKIARGSYLAPEETATLRSFIYETLEMEKPSEYRLAQQIIEEELPSIPRYQVARLWDGDYWFSNPLWIYIKAVENMAELVMRFT